jgi:hypothetical protein
MLLTPFPSGIISLRFYQTGSASASYSANQWLFQYPTNATFTAEPQTTVPNTDGVQLGPFNFQTLHPKLTTAAVTINWTESSVAKSATLAPTKPTQTLSGTNASNIASASMIQDSGMFTVTWATGHAPDANSVTVTYTLRQSQAWSKGMSISAVGANLFVSFDGVNDHACVLSGTTVEFLDRYEAGIAVRGSGATYYLSIW